VWEEKSVAMNTACAARKAWSTFGCTTAGMASEIAAVLLVPLGLQQLIGQCSGAPAIVFVNLCWGLSFDGSAASSSCIEWQWVECAGLWHICRSFMVQPCGIGEGANAASNEINAEMEESILTIAS
jgi:hypothetical protein